MNELKRIGILGAVVLGMVSVSEAREGEGRPPHGRQERVEPQQPKQRSHARDFKKGGERHKRFIQKFDEDKDGRLSKQERQKAREAMQRYRQERQSQMKLVRQRFMEKFDANKDGVLSEPEREAARQEAKQQMGKFKAKLLAEYDADGDGQLSKQERMEGHKEEKRKLLKQFDADGSGELDESEKKAAFEFVLENEPHRLMRELRGRSHHKGARKRKARESKDTGVALPEKQGL